MYTETRRHRVFDYNDDDDDDDDFLGRASPSKLNLKFSLKLVRNNSKYNFKDNFKRSDQVNFAAGNQPPLGPAFSLA